MSQGRGVWREGSEWNTEDRGNEGKEAAAGSCCRPGDRSGKLNFEKLTKK